MNVDWLSRLPAPARRGLYFALQRALGSRVAGAWSEFQGWETLGGDRLEQRVEERLSTVLTTALRDCRYYRELGLLRRPGESAREFLRRFPPLERTTVRERFVDLTADPLRPEITSPESKPRRRYDWLVVKTGGTTGTPTPVVHDAKGRDWGRATRLYSARQCGHPLGTPYFRLWGSETDLLQTRATLPLRVQLGLLGAVCLNAFRVREAELARHYETMLRHPQVRSMMAYVDVAVTLARFIEGRRLPPPRLETIMACAGTVTPEARATLRDVFGAEVFDKYGSRDCCDMACECREHRGLHVYSPNVFLEIVDDANASCPPGQTGHILVTLLNNPGFPLVRYRIGDLGRWAPPAACPCGLSWPRIQDLQGRADDMLITEEGAPLSSTFIRHTVGVSLNRELIREWQVDQVGPRTVVFRYRPMSADGLAANLEELANRFRLVLGGTVEIRPEQVDDIPVSASGKVRWIVNSWKSSSPRETAGTDRSAAPPGT